MTKKIWTIILALTLAPVGFAKTKPVTMHQKVRASFYAPKFEGRKMANGQRFHEDTETAASMVFPLGSMVRVTSIETGLSVIVCITDRGPWNARYGLDLSKAAYIGLGLKLSSGWGWVTVQKVN